MTRDAALVHGLQELSDGELNILLVEDLRRLADELMQHATAVALLDAQALGVPADAAVDAVKNQFPDVRLMVAGHAAEQNLLASRIAQQRVFRFIHKPASPQRLKLFLEAATATPGERTNTEASADSGPQAGTGAALPPRGGLLPLPIIAGLAAALVVAVGTWLLMRKDAPADGAATAQTAAPAPEVAALLSRAEQASAARRHVAADGTSAAELYREALRLDPRNSAAEAGFEAATEAALTAAEQALLAGRLDEARSSAELLRLIVPDSSRLAFLYTQIERELARINADASQRQVLEARQAQIRAAVAAMEQRIQRGALLEPATDNAVTRFREAQTTGAGDPMVRGARDSLIGALLTNADKQLDAGQIQTARRLVEAAGSVNSSAPGLDIMRRRVEEAQNRQTAATNSLPTAPGQSASPPVETTVATPTAPITASTSPASVSAPAPAPPAASAPEPESGNGIVTANSLQILRRTNPDYPQQALQQLVSGWVDLEFTVARDGTVQDVVVTKSEPRRVFDSAAVAAIKRWRFAPVLRDGQPVEQRATQRMRFTAQDGQ